MALTQQSSKWARSAPTIRVGVLGLLAAILLVLPLALASRAEAFIYWAGCGDRDCTRPGGIGRANLDGTHAHPSFISGDAGLLPGLAVGTSHVYWTNGGVGRAKLDGSGVNPSFINPNFIVYGYALGVAVDTSHVYWTSPNSIGRANLDGSGVNPSFITGAGFLPRGVAVDARHIYWANPSQNSEFVQGSIGRANLNGTGVDPSFIAKAGYEPNGVAVDASHIYWTGGPSAIARAKLDGTHVDKSFIRAKWAVPSGVAVDANHVYFSQGSFQRPGLRSYSSIARANLDGTHVDKRFINAADRPAAVAVSPKLAGKATAATTQGQSGTKIVVRVRLRAKEQLTAKASGEIKVNPTYKLRPKKVQVAAGKTKTLWLKPKKKAAGRIAQALKRGEKAKAKVTVKLTDGAGNRETEKLRVRLRRG